MNIKRSLGVLLAATQLCLLLASCGETTSEKTGDTDAPSVQDTTVPVVTAPPTEAELRAMVDDELPEKTFGGKVFRIITLDNGRANYIVEDLTGEAKNDAIHGRNETVESRFNVTLDVVSYVAATPAAPLSSSPSVPVTPKRLTWLLTTWLTTVPTP